MSKKKLPLISVVVCCYNGADVLPDALRALQKQNWKGRLEIIVVDDGSADDTYSVAKSFKGVVVIQNEQNLGLAGSRNVGAEAAKGEIVAFTDDDCRPHRSWITELYAGYTDKHVAGVGGAVMSNDESGLVLRYLHASQPLKPLENTLLASRKLTYRFGLYLKSLIGRGLKTPNSTRSVYSLVGANMSFRKSALQAVGMFDARFRFGGEEEDLCKRLNEARPDSLVFTPKAKISHQFDRRLRDTLRRSKAYGTGNARMSRKHADVRPVIYPFPPLIALSVLLGFVSPWLFLAPLVLVQIVYSRWAVMAWRSHRPEPLLYGYIQFLQELYSNVGFIQGWFKFRHMFPRKKQPRPHILYGAIAAGITLFNVLEFADSPLQLLVAAGILGVLPGYLLLTALRVHTARLHFWMYAVTSSVAMLILLSLLLNAAVTFWPNAIHFGTPLFVVGVDVLLLVLLAFAMWCNPSPPVYAVGLRTVRAAWPALTLGFLPLLGVFGARLLNNTDNNVLSMAMLALAAAVATVLAVLFQRLRSFYVPLLLYVLSLTLLLLGSMRGGFVSGTDVSKEFYLLNLTQAAGHWSPSLYPDAYNACLSINLFPTLLHHVLRVDNETVFRVVIPAIFALVPVMMYAMYRKVAIPVLAILGSLFFVFQPTFMSWSAIPIRQMVGFIFFGALLLTLFDKSLRPLIKKLLVASFGVAMVLSHYSTTYLAIGILGVTYVLQTGEYAVRKILARRSMIVRPLTSVVRLWLIVFLLVIAAIWYGPVTHTGGNITHLASRAITGVRDGKWHALAADNHSQGTSLLDQFNVNAKPRNPQQALENYVQDADDKYSGVGITPMQAKDGSLSLTPVSADVLPLKVNPRFESMVMLVGQAVSKLLRLFLFVGLVVFAVQFVRRRDTEEGYQILSLAAAGTLLAVIILPYASVQYDVTRTAQQTLMLAALPTITGGLWLIDFLGRKFSKHSRECALAGVVVVFFLFVSGFIGQLTGGGAPLLTLNNKGNQYNQVYVHAGEIAAAKWLKANQDDTARMYAGYFGGSRLWLGGIERPGFYNDILPWTIDKDAYVYAGAAEVVRGTATAYRNGTFVNYHYPAESLDAAKNLIYSNGQSRIYK